MVLGVGVVELLLVGMLGVVLVGVVVAVASSPSSLTGSIITSPVIVMPVTSDECVAKVMMGCWYGLLIGVVDRMYCWDISG